MGIFTFELSSNTWTLLNDAIKISNYLHLSLDFLTKQNDSDAIFIPKTNEIDFYNNLIKYLSLAKYKSKWILQGFPAFKRCFHNV